MIRIKRLIIVLIAFALVFMLFTQLAQYTLAGEEGAPSKEETALKETVNLVYLYEGNSPYLHFVRTVLIMNNVYPDYSNVNFYTFFFYGWLFPRRWMAQMKIFMEMGKGIKVGGGDFESVVPLLKPIVIDAGNPYHSGEDKPAPRKVEDTKKDKKISRIFKSMMDIRFAFFKIGSGGGDGVCFAPDTLVLMEGGELKKIKDIVKGDFIVGYDFELGKSVPLEVLKVTATPHENIFLLNGKIEATGEHPFYPEANKFVKVKNFSDDMKTLLGDTDGDIDTLEEVELKSDEKVKPGELYYDLKFESVHTYFVSDGEGNLYLVRECD